MTNTVLLALYNFVPISHSEPDPDVHLHFYLPPDSKAGTYPEKLYVITQLTLPGEIPSIGNGQLDTNKGDNSNSIILIKSVGQIGSSKMDSRRFRKESAATTAVRSPVKGMLLVKKERQQRNNNLAMELEHKSGELLKLLPQNLHI